MRLCLIEIVSQRYFLALKRFKKVMLTCQAYGDFILDHTPNYVQKRPAKYPASLPWPETNTIVDSLAEMSRLNWP